MATSPMQTKSRAAIARAVMDLPPDADIGTVRHAIDQAYPFQVLCGWAFKMWGCERQRYLRARFPRSVKPTPLFDRPGEGPAPRVGRPPPRH